MLKNVLYHSNNHENTYPLFKTSKTWLKVYQRIYKYITDLENRGQINWYLCTIDLTLKTKKAVTIKKWLNETCEKKKKSADASASTLNLN